MHSPRKEHWLVRFYSFLKRQWNAVAAGVALIGYLVTEFFPARADWQAFFLFVGANAVVWTIIEIKLSQHRTSTPLRFSTLRSARESILDSVRNAIRKSHGRPLELHAIGGRFRTISSWLEEILREIASHDLNAQNVTFFISCLNPDVVESWAFDGIRCDKAFKKRMRGHAADIRLAMQRLTGFNTNPALMKANVKVVPRFYDTYPGIFAFVIGHFTLYWGYYTWEPDEDDFRGPENPCYRIDPRTLLFSDISHWTQNLNHFLCEVYRVPNRSAGELTPNIGLLVPEASLDQVARVNREAYDALASTYHQTGPERAAKMVSVLSPLFDLIQHVPGEETALLELGSGDGSLSALLDKRGFKVTALDFSQRMCDLTRQNVPDAEIICEEFLRADFGERRFSVLVAIAFIHLFPSYFTARVLRRIRTILTDDGVGFISTTLHAHSFEGFAIKRPPVDGPERYRRGFTKEEIESEIRSAGLSVAHQYENEDGLIPGKVWMNYIVQRTKGTDG